MYVFSKIQLFLKPIRVGCLLPPDIISTIFSNVEAILSVNQELFFCMRQHSLGEAFTYLGPFLKLYSTYANNFQNANSVLQVTTVCKVRGEPSWFENWSQIATMQHSGSFVPIGWLAIYSGKSRGWGWLSSKGGSKHIHEATVVPLPWQDWLRSSSEFHRFISVQESRPECRGLVLSSLLITPVQRIPR